jgi:16S rRNA C967 or C1407 C5-methylase (RsmB/RsmF family)
LVDLFFINRVERVLIDCSLNLQVYVHLTANSKQVPRGLLLENYLGTCAFLGVGKSNCKRSDYFSQDTGVGVTMTKLAGPTLPPLNGVLIGKIMLQNLPSAIVVHALDPQKGDVILDMCSAPGGKTSHIASLIGNDGLVIACEKGKKKMLQAREFFQSMGASCIVPIATDSTKLLITDDTQRLSPKEVVDAAAADFNKDGLLKIKGFHPESFDRILLDPPCSALGLRPKLQVDIKSLGELLKHAEYQQHFVRCAVPLLKSGGTMTYSTCTIDATENEEMVKFILSEFPCMKLVPMPDNLPGLPALRGFGLSEEECKMVRRFDPCNTDIDSMGFFIAKFQKC